MNKVLPAKVPTYVGCRIPILAISTAPLSLFIEKNQLGLSTHSYKKKSIMKRIEDILNEYDELKQRIFTVNDQFKQDHLISELINHIS
jgi:hypothetical protein